MRRLLPALVLVAAGCQPAPPVPADPAASPTSVAASEPTAAPRACRQPCRRRPHVVGSFGRANAPEASGVAASRRNPGLLYVVDDGPGTTSLLVIRARDGHLVGRLAVEGLDGVDTEDLAVGPCDRTSDLTCVYVGDIGDNVQGRDDVSVVRFEESAMDDGLPGSVVGESIALTYPDGPHDAEALLVDGRGTIGIVTKSAGRHGRGGARLFLADQFGDGMLTAGPAVRLPPPRRPFASAILGNVVTGGDATPGGVVLRTYDAIYEFRGPRGAPLRAFPAWHVTQLPPPSEPQGEAVAYGVDGCSVYTVSEDSGQLTALRCH